MNELSLEDAVQWLREADGLLIAAGAGMGVDSGLPDFRGREGFWRAYPALAAAGLAFEEIANPANFDADPTLAWGFYGHRLVLYRATTPHAGFTILQDFAARMAEGAAVYTSNVDGHFQRAGFDVARVYEIHGSIHHLQCHRGCGQPIWPADDFQPEIDTAQCRLLSPLPRCPSCGGLARPNILMFSDWDWQSARSDLQAQRLAAWLQGLQRPVVIEIGAGTAIPSVRRFAERVRGRLIRINPREPQLPAGRGLGLAEGGLAGLQCLAAAWSCA